MITRITRALLFVQFIAAAAIAWLAMRHLAIHPAIALFVGISAVLLLRLLITANNFFLAWRHGSVTPVEYRLDLQQACRLFFGEYQATIITSSWAMPFHAFTATRLASQPAGLPVLLVHGYGCNSGYWHAMSKALAQAQISHYALDLEPITCGIDEYAPMIHAAVERLCHETGHDRIVIVAHSMGGLAVRACLRNRGNGRIAKVVTLGTPHHGTVLALYGIGANTAQMRWIVGKQEGLCSPWLRALAQDENPAVYRLFVSIYSHHDNIVSPQTSAHLEGAKNIGLYGTGHVALAFCPAVQTLVIDEIRKASLPVLASR